jgi:hypothetical protein
LAEIRADGLDRDLLEHVWHRLEDRAVLDRADLWESIEQMRHGGVVVLRPLADEDSMMPSYSAVTRCRANPPR